MKPFVTFRSGEWIVAWRSRAFAVQLARRFPNWSDAIAFVCRAYRIREIQR